MNRLCETWAGAAPKERLPVRLQLHDSDPEQGHFRGLASVFNSPIDAWVPTIIRLGAFTKTLQDRQRKVLLLWQHNMDEPIGVPVEMRETDVGLETEAHWRQLPADLRKDLRRFLKRKSAIVGQEVLDVASALCERGAFGLAFDLYQVLDGQPRIPYQGCGFGLMMNLKALMGERSPDPSGTILVT
jgi:Caudovirus prohead serine protease